MAKDLTKDIPTQDLVRVQVVSKTPYRPTFGLKTGRYLGDYQTNDVFLMPRVDYDELIRRGKNSYKKLDDGIDLVALPGIGESLANELRVDYGVISKQDIINLGVDGLQKVHSTITEKKAWAIMNALGVKNEKPGPSLDSVAEESDELVKS